LTSYSYDLAGRSTSVSDNSASIAAVSATASYAATYSYDALNRPITASWTPTVVQTAPTQAGVTFTHSYDANNRRVGQTASDNSWLLYPATTGTTSYTANNLNQYTAVGGASPTYDNNGNLTFDGTVTYCYDVEGRLTRAITAGTCASPTTTLGAYAFDAQGRRKSKTAGGATTITVADADNREVLEYDGTSGAIQRWYAYGAGSNDVLGQMNVAAGTRTTLVPDIQGSFIASMASNATTFSKANFLPYGENAASTSGTFRYTGSRIDPETVATSQPSGLYYMRARAYSPQWGRFIQVDPIGYQGGINLYAYTRNDPLNQTDLNGLFTPGVDTFPTREEAAVDALDYINPRSISENREYGGAIIPVGDRFMATTPIAGTESGVTGHYPGNMTDDYHTHADYSLSIDGVVTRTSTPLADSFDSNNFSTGPSGDTGLGKIIETKVLNGADYERYLGTPSGAIKAYKPSTDTVRTVRPANPIIPIDAPRGASK